MANPPPILFSGKIDRDQALTARPVQLPVVRTEDRDDGGLLVTVELTRAGWKTWLGAPQKFVRTFGLDTLGREVYEACDGKNSVKRIVRDFAKTHHITVPEAEISVATYLKTLMTKGLIAMGMMNEKESS